MEQLLKILVIDDDPVVRMAIGKMLRVAGMNVEVIEAPDGLIGKKILEKENFDCVFLDYHLPITDGLTVFRELRAAGVKTPIIILTGQGNEEIAVEMMKSGVADYLSKMKISPDNLAQTLRNAIGRYKAELQKAEEEKALSNREALWRLVIENVPTGIIAVDEKFMIKSVNAAGEKMFGYGVADMVGQNSNMLILEAYHDKYDKFVSNYLRSERGKPIDRDMEMLAKRKDGSIFPIEVYLTDFWLSQERNFIVLVRDITERKRVEEMLKSRNKLYRSIVEDQTELICRYLSDGTITYINEVYCDYFSKKHEELIGKNIKLFFRKETKKKTKKYFANVSQENPVLLYEESVKLANSDIRWIQWTNRAIFDEHGKIIEHQRVGRDITDLKLAEQELIATQNKAAQAEKLASLGAMAAGITHEINQPLNALKITVDSMLYWQEKGKTLDMEKVIDNLYKISAQASRIDRVIKNMRSLVRSEKKLELIPCNLNGVVDGALSLLESQLSSRGIKLKKILGIIPLIKGDYSQAEEVVINLVVNAMQALDEIDKDEKEIICITMLEENQVILEISDNAIGIREEIKDKIFAPFFTTKEVGEGMGIGLSIANSIVASFNGQIKVFNNKKGGATFRVEFPLLGQGD